MSDSVAMVDATYPPDISIVVPCYNEEDNAAAIAAAIIAQMEQIPGTFDLIFIDNASTDNTVPIIRTLCAGDPRIRLIVNTRNFGQMRSPTHAVFEARGRAVIGICADFEDPPELLPLFIERWRAGADIVLGVRNVEKARGFTARLRDAYYAFTDKFADYPVIRNATGFGLYDRKVVRAIAEMKEPEPFFRGMLVETGYTVETIPYARVIRTRGSSSNNFFTLLNFALSSLASFSKKLVRAPFFIGAFAGMAAGVSLVAAPIAWLLGGSAVSWLIAAGVEVQFALLFISIALMGDQIRLVSERTRGTPLVFERERVNFPDGY